MRGRPVLEVVVAGAVAVALFSALPLWFLSTQEGWVRVRCGGSPWVCTVQESNLLVRRSERYLPREVSSRRLAHQARGREQVSWQLVFLVGTARLDALRASTENGELPAFAADLERARLLGAEVDRALAPDFGFWLAVALVALFASAGAFIVIAGNARRKR